MKPNSTLRHSLILAAAAVFSGHAEAATTASFSDATIVSTGFVNAGANPNLLGRENGNTNTYRVLVAFSVPTIILNDPRIASIADFTASNKFDFKFNALAGFLLHSSTYTVEYLGFFANATLPDTGSGSTVGAMGTWIGKFSSTATQTVNTGVADTNAAQAITGTGFTLSGITESNSSNDAVLFRISYGGNYVQNTFQNVSGFTLIPEPSAALLGGIGVLMLLRRKRQ
jgi:hypothetical protein